MDKSRIFRTIALAVVGVLVGVNFYLFNAQSIVRNSMPMPFGVGASVVLSGSMEPTLSVNDLIIVKQTDTINVDDIVVFQSKDILVVHRVKTIEGDVITTQGDANNVVDDPVNRADIKGKVVATIPYLGIVVNFLKTPIGIIVVLGLTFLLLEKSYKKQAEDDNVGLDEIREQIEQLKQQLKEGNE